MRFRLRTLLILVTVVCFGLGWYVYRLGQRGSFVTGVNFELRFASNPKLIAEHMREKVGSLPQHEPAGPFTVSKRFGASQYRRHLETVSDQIFFRTTLRDGSETLVGFWVYPSENENEVIVSCVLQGHDHYLHGPAKRRHIERSALMEQYQSILRDLQASLEQTHWTTSTGLPP